MKPPQKDEQGFTLFELLVVLANLAVLATIVFLSVSNTFQFGARQAYDIEHRIIQQAVSRFYLDSHTGPGSGWGAGPMGHHYPTIDGQAVAADLEELLEMAGGNREYFSGGANGAIWMGLLVNSPADGLEGNESPAWAHPQGGERGPYLNGIAESSSVANGGILQRGSYTWVVCRDGSVYGLYWDETRWRAGFGASYP